MRIAAIGVGRAGGRIVDAMYRDDATRAASYLGAALVFDTDTASLETLRSVPSEARHPLGVAETGGSGTGGDRTAGVAAAEHNADEIRHTVDDAVTAEVEAILLIAGLAGGTGSGATPHVARAIEGLYDRPVYAVTVLPEQVTDRTARNVLTGLRGLETATDARIGFDNARFLEAGAAVDDRVNEVNGALIDRLGALFAAGDAEEAGVGGSELRATVAAGGFTTLGYATRALESADDGASSVLDRVRDALTGGAAEVDEVAAIKAVETTVRQAVYRGLSMECPLDGVERGLLSVAGPPAWLHRTAVMNGRSWLDEELGGAQLRAGERGIAGASTLSVVVVLSGIEDPPRLAELRARVE